MKDYTVTDFFFCIGTYKKKVKYKRSTLPWNIFESFLSFLLQSKLKEQIEASSKSSHTSFCNSSLRSMKVKFEVAENHWIWVIFKIQWQHSCFLWLQGGLVVLALHNLTLCVFLILLLVSLYYYIPGLSQLLEYTTGVLH